MFARPEDLLALAGLGGRPFEGSLRDLIGAEASRHGILPADVHWDHRTNLPDGGRDIVVDAEHVDASPRFVPQRRSIWSAKSGKDGTQSATLREELLAPHHEEVRRHLRGGNPYIWCTLQPLDEDGRTALQDKVREIAESPNGFLFNPSLVLFRGLTDLCALLNDHPGLLAKHLSGVARRMEGFLTLPEWEQLDRAGFDVSWVDFASRSEIVSQVRDHLRARSGANILHLAGLSGVGKTRTVLEACRGQRDLDAVLYVRRYSDFGEPLLRHLTRNEDLLALVVVDEVPLEDVEALTSQVQDYPQRLRFVTIGPARRNERGRPSANILLLTEPDTSAGVFEIVRRAGAELSVPVLESIARFSAHDLRLALMLVEATKQDGALHDLPIEDGEGVWNRVTSLFRNRLRDPAAFQAHYPYLTVGIDVGIQGKHRQELEHVAAQFVVPTVRLDEAIADASLCGLGATSPNFFEPAPRALAGHLFRRRVWGALRLRLPGFLSGMTDRLLRRFVERCQECVGEEREEMELALADFFRPRLGAPDVTQLVDRQRSRLFKAWAELAPEHGLPWLREAVERASDAQLTAFDGAPDGSGGWRGRRQVVWLCESLACFADYFRECEAILFRLAQAETEPAIGNNSTIIWKELFVPAPAFTEAPFPERSDLLFRRLQETSGTALPLVFAAVVEALDHPGMRLMPPAIVGGRVVPEPWRPATYEELRELQRNFARRALTALGGLEAPLGVSARQLVIDSLHVFAGHGLVAELREFLGSDRGLRQALRLELRGLVERREELRGRKPSAPPDPVLESLRRWSEELAPTDLPEQVRELTSLNYWDAMRGYRPQEGHSDA